MGKKIAQIDKGQMRRVLGVFDLFAVGYGDLGSSIYYALGITAMYSLGATPLALLMAGLVFVCTALTYAEMSSVIPESGGSASFSRKAFNDLISFVAGWGLMLDYIVTIAISAFSVAPYLGFFFPVLKEVIPQIAFTIFIILAMLVLNIKGNKHSTRFSMVLTLLTVFTQAIIVVIGAATIVNLPEFIRHLKINRGDLLWSPTWSQFWHGVAMAMVAYTGIESMSQLSSEAINPKKTVPRAIVLAMGTLLIMYLGISTIALSAVTPQVLSTTYLMDPIAGIVKALPIGGAFLGPWVGLLAAVILIVAANAGLIGASRLSFNMGEYFQLPRRFYGLHSRYKTPYVSLVVFAVLSSLIVISSRGRLDFLADLYNFGAMLAFFSSHISLISHRIRFPKIKRPFKSPLNIPIGRGRSIPVTAILGALTTLSVWVLVVITKPQGRYLGLAWIIFGLAMYFRHRKQFNLSPTGSVEVKRVIVKDFKEVSIKKILLPTRGHLATDTIVIGCNLAKLYDAELTIIHVVEIPYMLPIDAPVLEKEAYSEAVLNRAQAIAIEKHVNVQVKMVRARSVVKAILDLVEKEGTDLLVLGSKHQSALGSLTEKLLEKVPCRVWICCPEDHKISPQMSA
jgi:APA family basic amino acid/polyamine antiporter